MADNSPFSFKQGHNQRNFLQRKQANNYRFNTLMYKSIIFFSNYRAQQQIVDVNVLKYLLKVNTYLLASSSLSRNHSICQLTGRTRSIYRIFQLSRIKIREHAGFGIFLGIAKSY